MEMDNKRKDLIANVAAVLLFLVTYGLCVLFGWLDIANGLFTSTGENVGEVFETPIAYTLICLLFFAVMYALAVMGIKLKNKVMVLLPLLYEVILILSIVMLAFYATGGIENETLFGIVGWVLVFGLAPAFGPMWSLSVWLVILMVIALIIATIVGLVKVFKKDNTEKKPAKK